MIWQWLHSSFEGDSPCGCPCLIALAFLRFWEIITAPLCCSPQGLHGPLRFLSPYLSSTNSSSLNSFLPTSETAICISCQALIIKETSCACLSASGLHGSMAGLFTGTHRVYLCWSAGAARVQSRRLGSLNDKNLFSHSSGSWKCEIQVPA